MKKRITIILSMCLVCILINGCAVFQGNKPEKDIKEGIGFYDRGDYEKAIIYFKECIAVDQNNSDYHLWLGNALLERGKEGDLKSALIEFKKAVDTSKDREKALAQIRSFFFERADKYSQKGDIYMESRCYLAYTENFNKNDVDAYIKLGNVMLAMGNPLGALYYAKKAKALDPNNKAVRELMDTLNSPTH